MGTLLTDTYLLDGQRNQGLLIAALVFSCLNILLIFFGFLNFLSEAVIH